MLQKLPMLSIKSVSFHCIQSPRSLPCVCLFCCKLVMRQHGILSSSVSKCMRLWRVPNIAYDLQHLKGTVYVFLVESF